MEKVKNVVKEATSATPQFAQGHKVPITHQAAPGHQNEMPIQPQDDHLPTADGGSQLYKAAGKLAGKRALITGGDSGIGRATAILFAMEGAEVMITYLPVEKEDAIETGKKVREKGATFHSMEADLRERTVCKSVVEEAVKLMGGVDILFNNAAFQMVKKSIEELDEDQWVKTFDTNIHPFFFLSKYILPHLKPGATIINNGSINAYIGRPDLLDYTSTKGAVIAFTRALSNQLISRGIRVNAVCPGPVWTPLIPATMDKDAQDDFTSPMGRPGQPSEIASVVVFLAGPDSSLISGQSLHPNGGVIVNG